jgi:uncharacterized protein YukE
MGILEVDTTELTRLAERIRLAAAEAHAASADPGPLQSSIARLADPALIQAAASFLSSWGHTLAGVVGDARRLADAIDLVAHGFQDAESAVARSMFR